MKPKQLQCLLSSLNGFENPDVTLEQYSTSPELAVSIVECIDRLAGLENKLVADFGSGAGMLSAAIAAYEPSASIFGIEIDPRAIETCQENWEDAGVDDRCQLIQADVLSTKMLFPIMDIVVMNPPFGTKNNRGLDIEFVKAGLSCLQTKGSLFSLHKSSTRDFVLNCENNWENIKVECVAQLRWDLPATYKFHKKKSVDISVDLMHFKKF